MGHQILLQMSQLEKKVFQYYGFQHPSQFHQRLPRNSKVIKSIIIYVERYCSYLSLTYFNIQFSIKSAVIFAPRLFKCKKSVTIRKPLLAEILSKLVLNRK